MVKRRRAGYNLRSLGHGHVLIPTLIRYARVLLLPATLIIAAGQPAPARAGMEDPLASRLSAAVVQSTFPDADGIGDVAGDPPVAPALKDGETVGYLFSTFETVSPRGYGGEPFDIIVGIDGDGRITGTHLLEQHEPIRTELSHKYSNEAFAELAAAAGLEVSQTWTDDDRLFSVLYLLPR